MSIYLREADKEKIGKEFCSALERALDGHDYEVGEVEAANYSASNTQEFLGRFCLMLIEKGIVSYEDIKKCIDPGILGYNKDGNWKWPK